MNYNFKLTIIIILVAGMYIPATPQSNNFNTLGVSFDVIQSWAQTYNIEQNVLDKQLNFSIGSTFFYERKIWKGFNFRGKVGYYKISQKFNFPGILPLIDHSLKNIGTLEMDAIPIGINIGYTHQINQRLSVNFSLGLISYLLFRPLPSSNFSDLNPHLTSPFEGSVNLRNYTVNDIYSHDFIHSWELGFGIYYSISSSNRYKIFIDNNIRAGFRPYYNYEISIYSRGIPPPYSFDNKSSTLVSSLFFNSIGISYEF